MLPSVTVVKILHKNLREFPVRGMLSLNIELYAASSCKFSILVDLVISLKAALVVDPVMVSTSGDVLAGPSILTGFR